MLTGTAFLLFFAAMLLCLVKGWALSWALGFALVLFFLLGLKEGWSVKELAKMAWTKMPKTFIVLRILFFIGLLTGLWRSSGTIAYFIYYGIRFITPSLFILIAFLLTVLLSFALGTSFGVTSTAGIVLMAIARAGGVNPLIAAGAIISGVYFGDRGAPTSSCAALVAAITETDLYGNVRRMFKNALLPTLLSLGFYTFLSFRNPITTVDDTLLTALGSQFRLSLWLVVPAVIMLILPVFKVPIRIAMAISAGAAFLVTLFLQDMSAGEALKVCLLGYHPDAGILTDIVSGGGLISMETPFIMLPLASLYTGILEGTGALENVQALLRKLSNKLGLLPAMNIVSILAAAVLCNQTIVIIMTYQVMAKVYEDEGASKEELAMDIANSGVTISGLVPWCIACSVPLSMLEVGPSALPYACLLYLIPICYLFTKRFFYPEKKNA